MLSKVRDRIENAKLNEVIKWTILQAIEDVENHSSIKTYDDNDLCSAFPWDATHQGAYFWSLVDKLIWKSTPADRGPNILSEWTDAEWLAGKLNYGTKPDMVMNINTGTIIEKTSETTMCVFDRQTESNGEGFTFQGNFDRMLQGMRKRGLLIEDCRI